MEIIQVLVSGHRLPGTAAKIGAGIAGRQTVLSLPEIEIIAVFPVRILQSLLEPFMLVRAMVDDQIHDDVHVPLFCFCQQFIKLLHGAKGRVNSIIIRNVITLIHKGRSINRRDPDNIHTQFLQVIQPGKDSFQVTDSVTVGILKALGINLVGNLIVPPFFCNAHNRYLSFAYL